MSGSAPETSRSLLPRVALGGLLLQAAFTTERRQGLGAAAALAPAASLWSTPEARRAYLRRHLADFNTNPAFAGPILGAVVRLEQEASAAGEEAAEGVVRLKSSLEGPFAARGDALLWGGARPAAGLWGAAVSLVAGAWGPLLFLVLFNLVHLGFRVGGVFWGYRRGRDVHRLLRANGLRRATAAAAWLVLPGSAVLAYLAFGPGSSAAGPAALGVLASGVGLVMGRRGFSRATLLGVLAVLAGCAVAYFLDGGTSVHVDPGGR